MFLCLPRRVKRELELRITELFVHLTAVVNMSRSHTPDTVVEFVSQQIEQGNHRHVKTEEAQQTSITQESKERIDPEPNKQVHPYNPVE